MGTGVSIMLSLPDPSCQVSSGHSKPDSSFSSFKLACLFGQALDLLVSVRLTCPKRAELLTTHPSGSYELVKDDKGQLTLKITNPTEFWSVSRYLVIQVK